MGETVDIDQAVTLSAVYESPEQDKLAEALAKAQGAIDNPTRSKRAEGKSYGYNYASLDQIRPFYRMPLANNGLSISSVTRPGRSGVVLHVRLMHSSGQWRESSLPVLHTPQIQEFGKQLTYYRRYLICGLLDISTSEDDTDGHTSGDVEISDRVPPVRPDVETVPRTEPQLSADSEEFVKKLINELPKLSTIEELNKHWPIDRVGYLEVAYPDALKRLQAAFRGRGAEIRRLVQQASVVKAEAIIDDGRNKQPPKPADDLDGDFIPTLADRPTAEQSRKELLWVSELINKATKLRDLVEFDNNAAVEAAIDEAQQNGLTKVVARIDAEYEAKAKALGHRRKHQES